jgi:predicted HTH domain antitoxin
MRIIIDLPDNTEGLTEYDIKMLIANKLYENGIIGLDLGTRIVGINKIDFIKKMGKYGVGMIHYTEEEFEKEMENARKI